LGGGLCPDEGFGVGIVVVQVFHDGALEFSAPRGFSFLFRRSRGGKGTASFGENPCINNGHGMPIDFSAALCFRPAALYIVAAGTSLGAGVAGY